MRSTLEQRRSAWRRRALLLLLLGLLAISLLTSGSGQPASRWRSLARSLAAPAPSDPLAATQRGAAVLPAQGKSPSPRPTSGSGTPFAASPWEGDEVQSSRVDPLYGRIAAELIERISGRAGGFAGDVRVICWSEKDWRRLVVSFQDAGKIDALEYWLGWALEGRGSDQPLVPRLPAARPDRLPRTGTSTCLPPAPPSAPLHTRRCTSLASTTRGSADCYAMQLTAVTALGLGADGDYADLTTDAEFRVQPRAAKRDGVRFSGLLRRRPARPGSRRSSVALIFCNGASLGWWRDRDDLAGGTSPAVYSSRERNRRR